MNDLMGTYKEIESSTGDVGLYSLKKLEEKGYANVKNLPVSIKILLESLLRKHDEYVIYKKDIENLAAWNGKNNDNEFAFFPARVIMQDFTGVPAVVDLAAMRNAMEDLGGDPKRINPLIPVDLVIDHSLQVDDTSADAENINLKREFERNQERYTFLKWGQHSFQNFQVVPPANGIVHQVNLERLGEVVTIKEIDGEKIAYPDSVVGTDSHTTMINGLSILGWGVGGIEAEAVMLGQAIYMLPPEVIGVKLSGDLKEEITATDLVLTIVEVLRNHGVVGKFVEFYGEGCKKLSLPDRATLANMAPEYGATMGYFAPDKTTIEFLKKTGRSENIELIEAYLNEQEMLIDYDSYNPTFTQTLEVNLNEIEASLAGPKRPQDRITVGNLKNEFEKDLTKSVDERGFGLEESEIEKNCVIEGGEESLSHGSLVIAAITSCTNTSNPSVLIAAGLLAKKALEKGLKVPDHIKTSLAPGSRVVSAYLEKSGLLKPLEEIGYKIVGYGCTSCIGNSGPLKEEIIKTVKDNNIISASVLSGNRNFEGRVNPLPKANYLASPPLVIAYSLAGKMNIDLENEAIGKGNDGEEVYLKDIWHKKEEIQKLIDEFITEEMFKDGYKNVFTGTEQWLSIETASSDLYPWDADSSYIKHPNYFEGLSKDNNEIEDIKSARVLVVAGDSTTTDHISPAGAIAASSPAADYLREKGIEEKEFNSYGSRRGNHEVMMRGTFANVRFRNLLTPGKEGSSTLYFSAKDEMTIYDAAMKYKEEKTPVIILAGKDYGMGSSRDWAAKGPALLGVKAVIAESYERIHRSNLIGMGVLPLQFMDGETPSSLALDGSETYDFHDLDQLKPGAIIKVIARRDNGEEVNFEALAKTDTLVEVDYIKNGGILQTVLLQMME